MKGYGRSGGQVGIRNHLLALPSVVCSIRGAAKAAMLAGGVAVEHPLGCAQIGDDKAQTRRVLVGTGSHPNVAHAVVIGLGCEGISAADVADGIRARGRRAGVYYIQEVGGTDAAAEAASRELLGAAAPLKDPSEAFNLVLGIADPAVLGEAGVEIAQEFLQSGGRLLLAGEVGEMGRERPYIPYAGPLADIGECLVMRSGAGDSEMITGLVAAGAHMVMAPADPRRLGGHPIAPVVRIGYQPRFRHALADDMDGDIHDRSAREWVQYLYGVAAGALSVSEQIGANTGFAILRTGPTL